MWRAPLAANSMACVCRHRGRSFAEPASAHISKGRKVASAAGLRIRSQGPIHPVFFTIRTGFSLALLPNRAIEQHPPPQE